MPKCPGGGHPDDSDKMCGDINRVTQKRCSIRPHPADVRHHCCGASWKEEW